MSTTEVRKSLQNLLPGKRYIVRVRSYDNFNIYSPWSEALEFNTPLDTSIPSAPSGLVFDFQGTDLHLEWDAPVINVDGSPCNDVTTYSVVLTGNSISKTYRAVGTRFDLSQLVNTRDFTDGSHLFPAHAFSAQIKALDTSGNISAALVGTVTNLPPATPSAGPDATTAGSSAALLLNPEATTDVGHYVIQYSIDDSTWLSLATSSVVNYIDSTLGGASERYYRFKIVDVFNQESAYSPSTHFIIDSGTSTVRNITTTATVAVTDKVLVCTATGGDYTITLPTAVSATGKTYIFKKTDASNTITIDGNGAETIDGSANTTLSSQWSGVTLFSTGTQWLKVL